MFKKQSKGKVFVGLSGGVDSAVSALLLKRAGYDVTGVFIKVWQPDWVQCTWPEDRRDAMRVAAHLDIPFISLDLEKEYKEGVADYMIREYKQGRTPNPDVMCNKEVKFGAFYRFARLQGADFIATGHYARVRDGLILVGVDKNKDQSYFLWTLKQELLPKILFPVGGLQKSEVRNIASKYGLPNASRKDSQGLCFIGKVDMKDFLKHYIPIHRGNVLDDSGEVIGSHEGVAFVTIGERHGFTIFDKNKTANDAPYYVIDKDVDMNTITVSHRDNIAISHEAHRVTVNNVNWISGSVWNNTDTDDDDYPLLIRARYREDLRKARIESVSISSTVVKFEKPHESLASGQSLVFYKGDICLGGGIIE